MFFFLPFVGTVYERRQQLITTSYTDEAERQWVEHIFCIKVC